MTETKTKNAVPAVKKIGKTTYIVKVHFSKGATETMSEKIERMIRQEIQQNKQNYRFCKKMIKKSLTNRFRQNGEVNFDFCGCAACGFQFTRNRKNDFIR